MNKRDLKIFYGNFNLFLYIFSSIWAIGLVFLLLNGYINSFLLLNRFHFNFADLPILLLTNLADGGFMAFLFIFLFIKKQPLQLIMILLTIIISGILAQIFKNYFFSDWHRPPYLLSEKVHTIGKYILNHHSFPSGHSTSIAAMFTMLAYYRSRFKSEIILYAVLCPFIAYTRIYLGVHFLGDVIAGLALGTITSLLLIILIKPFKIQFNSKIILLLRTISIIGAIIFIYIFLKKYL